MARLGWDWETTRRTDVNVIQLALEGHDELLVSIFGNDEEQRRTSSIMAPDRFRAFAHLHNRRLRAQRRG